LYTVVHLQMIWDVRDGDQRVFGLSC
jgi:hypothetical protein